MFPTQYSQQLTGSLQTCTPKAALGSMPLGMLQPQSRSRGESHHTYIHIYLYIYISNYVLLSYIIEGSLEVKLPKFRSQTSDNMDI